MAGENSLRDPLDNQQSFWGRSRAALVWLLALEVTDEERYLVANDPLNVFAEDYSNSRPHKRAAILALLFHLLLAIMSMPWLSETVLPIADVLVLNNLALPPARAAGGSPPKPATPEPKPKPVAPKPEAPVVPIPDPTPADPEPIRKEIVLETPNVMDEIAADLNIGDLEAPDSGRGRGQEGTGVGRSTGAGDAAGDGSGIYELGSGITNPVLIQKTTPSYTDEAIKAKVQGVVLLSAVIGKDGSVSQLRVLRGLGYGLEEKAIQEIATNWRFLPGRRGDIPVAVRATIEVTFNLR